MWGVGAVEKLIPRFGRGIGKSFCKHVPICGSRARGLSFKHKTGCVRMCPREIAQSRRAVFRGRRVENGQDGVTHAEANPPIYLRTVGVESLGQKKTTHRRATRPQSQSVNAINIV